MTILKWREYNVFNLRFFKGQVKVKVPLFIIKTVNLYLIEL